MRGKGKVEGVSMTGGVRDGGVKALADRHEERVWKKGKGMGGHGNDVWMLWSRVVCTYSVRVRGERKNDEHGPGENKELAIGRERFEGRVRG